MHIHNHHRHVHLPFRVIHSNLESIIRTNSCLVTNTAGGVECLSSAIFIATISNNFDYASTQSSSYTHVTDITISICGNLMMIGTATHRVIHCVSSLTARIPSPKASHIQSEQFSFSPPTCQNYLLPIYCRQGRQGIIDMLSVLHWQSDSATLDSSNCFMVSYLSV